MKQFEVLGGEIGTNITRRKVLRDALLAAAVAAVPEGLAHGAMSKPRAETADTLWQPSVLWYDKPAQNWGQALALGNGKLGAMVYGGYPEERIGLNEDTLWAGGPYSPAVKVDPAALAQIRSMIFAGNAKEAQNLADKTMEGDPRSQAPYQTVGDFVVTFANHDEPSNYRRELSLDDGIASTTYKAGGVTYFREVLASVESQAVVVHLRASKPGQISFIGSLITPQEAEVGSAGSDVIALSGTNGDMIKNGKVVIPHALKFQCWVNAVPKGGTVAVEGGKLIVSQADEVTIYIVAATSYKNYQDVSGDPEALCRKALMGARAKPYAAIRETHIADHQKLFHAVRLDLGTTGAAKLPTNQRPGAYRGDNDPSMAALYFQFGRYLLMSCSRPGGQPANLQGMWNDQLSAAWDGKYTININTEMNYWPAYTTNLIGCDEALFSMVKDLSVTGSTTARLIYNARGWVCHHNTDLWRATAPIDGAFWGLWPTGGAWLCNALYERYHFLQQKDWLVRLYPIIKGAAQFFLDTLVVDPNNGWLVTCPSMSPEHERVKGLTICAGPTMDMQIIRELFTNCEQASTVLDVDADFRAQCAASRKRLAPMQVGKEGQLQEWLDDIDADVPDVGHRHMSPLYGLFPGNQITKDNPKLFKAARKLMEMRVDKQGMGWATAWRVNLWSRLQDGDRAHSVLVRLLSEKTEGNLFDEPSRQLDGNFGGTAGIAEMLLQSHTGEIVLLPALPSVWRDGKVSGLLARGGFTVAMEWKNAKLKKVTLSSKSGADGTVRFADHTAPVRLAPGGNVTLDGSLQHV